VQKKPKMERFISSIKESYNELVNKVTWPTWSSLFESTRLVLVASVIITVIIFIMDTVANAALDLVYP